MSLKDLSTQDFISIILVCKKLIAPHNLLSLQGPSTFLRTLHSALFFITMTSFSCRTLWRKMLIAVSNSSLIFSLWKSSRSFRCSTDKDWSVTCVINELITACSSLSLRLRCSETASVNTFSRYMMHRYVKHIGRDNMAAVLKTTFSYRHFLEWKLL